MKEKKCLVYETLGSVQNLQIQEAKSSNDGLMRLTGVFGCTGIVNNNNRVYDKENYKVMVEAMQKEISESGVMGELEHPNSYNINLNNVSHKIESIQMNEDGTVTGTIVILNTDKGRNAKAIVEGGLPLYISSRGAGSITNEGRVTLSSIKTYDLVGTPGFSQAKLTLKEGQKLECLSEGLVEGNEVAYLNEGNSMTWVVIDEDENLLGGSDDEGDEDSKDEEPKSEGDKKEKEEPKKEKEEPKKDDKKSEDDKSDDENKTTTKETEKEDKNKDSKVTMEDLNKSIKELSEKVKSLEAELHVAQESLSNVKPVNYDAIEKWITEEFANEFKGEMLEEVDDRLTNATNTIAEGVQNWAVNEFAPEVQNWITEEFAPEVQNWITEEFAPEVQNWITEEFAPEVQNWITEEYSPVIEKWISEEFAPEVKNEINENVSAFIDSTKATRLNEIDSLLESISEDHTSLNNVINQVDESKKFKGIYVVESMPAQYRSAWELLNEDRQNEIVKSSKMYDFTKPGVLESFWSSVDFKKGDSQITESNEEVIGEAYHNNIFAAMKRLGYK